ncbi:MAG TPA: hypothetical protein VHW01_19000 [Polyangiaceae bacterium]|jgi:hypothetical protein|nr:hypothetical protein [Polyangiaceae bacterium]
MIVANRLTPLARHDAAAALAEAYARVTGGSLSARVLALLLAHTAFETGRWQKLHNFNFGNVKATPTFSFITQFRCSEVENGIEQFFDPPDPHCNFRAYSNAADGAVDYIKVLQSRPHWWAGLQSEDPAGFVDALATPPKYFTGDPVAYKRAIASLFDELRPLARAAVPAQRLASLLSRPRSSWRRFAVRRVGSLAARQVSTHRGRA